MRATGLRRREATRTIRIGLAQRTWSTIIPVKGGVTCAVYELVALQGRVRVSRAIITHCPSIIGVVLARRARLTCYSLRHVIVATNDGLHAVVGEVERLERAWGTECA